MSELGISGEVLPAVTEEKVYVPSLSVDDLVNLLEKVEDAKNRVLRETVDYDVIPGTGDKPTLLKPGAEKLCQLFGYRILSMDIVREQDEPFGVGYKCTLHDTRGRIVGVCDGWADRGERKARTWDKNTVMKMAQKRAFVGATLWACNASGIFTQDVEDFGTDDFSTPRTAPERATQPTDRKRSEEDYGVQGFKETVSWWQEKTGLDSEVEAQEQVIAAAQNCGFESSDDFASSVNVAVIRGKLVAELNVEKDAKTPKDPPVEETPGSLVLKKIIEDFKNRLTLDQMWECIREAGFNELEQLAEDGAYEMCITVLNERVEDENFVSTLGDDSGADDANGGNGAS